MGIEERDKWQVGTVGTHGDMLCSPSFLRPACVPVLLIMINVPITTKREGRQFTPHTHSQ